MTSLAFILGVLPLAISNGAGSASQHAIGTGVIGGMLTATFLAIFMIPMFFVVISNLSQDKGAPNHNGSDSNGGNGGNGSNGGTPAPAKEGH
jgi:multidrug efflux pump